MRDETTRQAAEEYLATKLTEDEQRYENEHNRAAAITLSLSWFGRDFKTPFSPSAASGIR
jgi:hypothetical protein